MIDTPIVRLLSPDCNPCLSQPARNIIMLSSDSSTSSQKSPRKVPSTCIDHTYRDFSTIELQIDHPSGSDDCELAEKSSSKLVSFPMKLHRMISDPKNSEIIHWMPHGRSWALKDKAGLEQLCKEYFRHDSFSSFNRSVNGWGFKRLKGKGPDYNTYYHEFFLRGKPDLCQLMKRLVNPGRRIPDPTSEPNFYEITELLPLPPDDHGPQFDAGEDEPFAVQAPQPFQGGHVQKNLAVMVPSSTGGVGLSQFAPTVVQPQNLHTAYVQGQAHGSPQLFMPPNPCGAENHAGFNFKAQLFAAYAFHIQAAGHPSAQGNTVRFQPYAPPQRATLSAPHPYSNAQVLQHPDCQCADEQPSNGARAAVDATNHGHDLHRKEYMAAFRAVSSVCSISSMESASSMSTIDCDGLFETEEEYEEMDFTLTAVESSVKQELEINFEKGVEPERARSIDSFMSDVLESEVKPGGADTSIMGLYQLDGPANRVVELYGLDEPAN